MVSVENQEAWKRVGQELQKQRARLGYPKRSSWVRHLGVTQPRTIEDLENGRRDNYTTATLAQIEGWYHWAPGSIQAVLQGEDPTLLGLSDWDRTDAADLARQASLNDLRYSAEVSDRPIVGDVLREISAQLARDAPHTGASIQPLILDLQRRFNEQAVQIERELVAARRLVARIPVLEERAARVAAELAAIEIALDELSVQEAPDQTPREGRRARIAADDDTGPA